MNKKLLAIVIMFIFLVVGFCGCIQNNNENKIIGTWFNPDLQTTLTINDDGTLTLLNSNTNDFLKGTYKLTNNTMILTITEVNSGEIPPPTEFNYELIDDNTLWMSDGSTIAVTYIRK